MSQVSCGPTDMPPGGSVAFASLAPRGWDVCVVDVDEAGEPRRLTDHPELDYNAALSPDGGRIAFVSQRDGNMELYVMAADGSGPRRLTDDFALDDHPTWSPGGDRIAFVSTRQASETPGRAWNGIYVMSADGSSVRRLSPADAADYSPAWSPKGEWIAFASGSGQAGRSDVCVMAADGSGRRRVIGNGGWPCFAADGASLYFHRRHEGKWGVWQVGLDGADCRLVSPQGIEAYTPRASADGRWLAMAVQRGDHRQIELMDLASDELRALTREAADHWNPSISADGSRVAYHKTTAGLDVPNVERWGSPPGSGVDMLRIAGAFPAFSPDGRRLAMVADGFATLDVMSIDGSGRRTLHEGRPRGLFSSSWAHSGEPIAFAAGGVFREATAEVNLLAVNSDGSGLRELTRGAGNNGFPGFSPDGSQLVFRSGRDGWKNLYIMNVDGSGLRRLTRGEWTDAMCDWSPTNDWIAFASDRDGEFDLWLIRPDGSGLHKLIGGGGRNNHPHFSRDGRWVVFTSERAGYSAEEISLPFQFQPYGDLFAVRVDGTGLLRLMHNGFEEGTPAWGPLRPSR